MVASIWSAAFRSQGSMESSVMFSMRLVTRVPGTLLLENALMEVCAQHAAAMWGGTEKVISSTCILVTFRLGGFPAEACPQIEIAATEFP